MAFFAALLAVALIAVATPIGEQVSCKIQSAVAALTGGSYSCEATEARDPYEVDPSTVVKASTENAASTEIGVTFKKLGPGDLSAELNDSTSVKETSYLDGSGSRSFISTQKLSGSYEVGGEIGGSKKGKGGSAGKQDNARSGFSAKLEMSAGVAGSRTRTRLHKCDSPGQPTCREFDENNSDAIDDIKKNKGAGRLFHGGVEVDDDVDVTSVADQYKLSVHVEASAGVGAGGEKDPLTGEKSARESVSGGLKFGEDIIFTKTESTAKTDSGEKVTVSYEFAYKGEVSASASMEARGVNESFGLDGEIEVSGSYAGKYKVVRDEDGELQAIIFTNVKEGVAKVSDKGKVGGEEGGGRADADERPDVTSTVEITLDVSALSPEQKEIAEDYVNSSFSNDALTLSRSALNPSKPSSVPFDNLLYEKAQVTRTLQKGTQVTDAGGVDFLLVHWHEVQSQKTTETLRVEQLGRPSGPGGERQYEEVEVP